MEKKLEEREKSEEKERENATDNDVNNFSMKSTEKGMFNMGQQIWDALK